MKKFYPSVLGRLCLTLSLSFFLSQFAKAQIKTYDTTFDGWNAIVTEDLSLHGTDSAAGIIFFPGIGQQTKNIHDLQVNGPHYLIKNGMWDGSVTLGNGVHHPFIISLQPPTSGYPATVVKPKIDAILARYRIKRSSLYFTGLSLGSWQANEFITYQATPGDHTYGRMIKAMVNLEGVEPADDAGIYSSLAYPGKMGDWAKSCGGRELWVEGSNDWRDMESGADNMNSAVPGSATYFMVNYGGGAHCCWNTEYEPSVTWTTASNKNIVKVDGNQVPMNVWQWLLRQGDTSMPGNAPAAPAATSPTVSAGNTQTITLPTNTTTLTGTAAGSNGAKITAIAWQQIGGPAGTKIASPGSLSTAISGLTIAGTYGYQLTVTDKNGKQAAAFVDVNVNPAAPATPPASKTPATTPAAPAEPPNVSAGGDPTITLPTTTVTLSGTAAGVNGAQIKSVRWAEASGPIPAKISSPNSLTTGITGLSVAGKYQFRLTATDQNGKQAASAVNVVVNPAPAAVKTAPPTVSAGKGQTINLPQTSITVTGTATGNGGAAIKGVAWSQASGPATASISAPGNLTTTVGGLTKTGSYVFRLTATDNKGASANGSMTVTVNAAKPAPPAAPLQSPTVNAGGNLTITLPTTSVTLKGTARGGSGSAITGVVWQESKGPVTARIASPGSLTTGISGLTAAGDYIFRLTVTDRNGKQAAAVVTVVVDASASKAPPAPPVIAKSAPTVSAGGNQTVTLPTSSATLKGSATSHDGGVMDSYFWVMVSGPGWVKFSNEWDPTTTVSGLVAGTYTFELEASDNNGETSNASMTLVVKPKAAGDAFGPKVTSADVNNTDADSINHAGGMVIYPNPVQSLLNIRLNNEITGKIIVGVFNMRGTRVLSQELDKQSPTLETSIDVSRLAAGVYVIEAISGPNMTTIDKFVKEGN